MKIKTILIIILLSISNFIIAKELTDEDKLRNAIKKLPAVGIIDEGIDLVNSQLKGSILYSNHSKSKIENPHATHLACLINKINTRLNFLSYDIRADKNKTDGILNGLKFMIKNKVKYILYASSSLSYSKQEEALLKLATDNGAYVFVSAGNDDKVIDSKNKLYPCSLKIKNLFCIGNRAKYSNKGDSVVLFDEGAELESCGLNNAKVKMKGTSQSTALFLGEFSKFIF
jgi:hypothetical protein